MQIAEEGLLAMENWMKELGLAMNLTQLGVTEEMIESLAEVALIMPGGYKILERNEIIKIFRESL